MIPNVHQWLSAFLLPLNINQGSEFVALARSVREYLELYQHYFLADFQQSMRRNDKCGIIPLPGNGYTIFEMQFLHLVEKHLFPIPEYVFEDPVEGSRCFGVPIEPYGLCSLYEYGDPSEVIEEMDLGWQLLLYLLHQIPYEYFDGMFDPPTDRIFDLAIAGEGYNLETLQKRCEEREGPLAFLYLAIAMLEHDTGTAWLDATNDMPIDNARWTKDDVDALAEQFVESQEIWEKAMQFIRWLETDIENHFTEVVHLWNVSQKKPHLNKQEEPPQE